MAASGRSRTAGRLGGADGTGSDASIRAVVPAEADCPAVIADGTPIPMQVRADPGPLFRPEKRLAPSFRCAFVN